MNNLAAFSHQPTLIGPRFNIRPLEESDYPALLKCASDKEIWAGHPATDRYKPEVFKPLFESSLASKACVVFIEISTGNIAGWSRLYSAEDGPEDISIGYTFLSRAYWGGASNFEIKSLLINYVFQYFDRVWFHIAPSNIRSQKATQKLGAVLVHEKMISLEKGQAATMTQSYKIEKTQWAH